jgi:hypothetical protein
MDDIVISKTYFENIVFDEINSEKLEFLSDNDIPKIYFLRVWLHYSETYVYKIGTTTKDLKKRIKQIDNEYCCNGKIIIIACGSVNSSNLEREFHNKLKKYKNNDIDITNPIKSKKQELYHISAKLYDKFMDLLQEESTSDIFESKKYVLDDDGEHYLPDSINRKYFSDEINKKIENNDNYIPLDKESIESDFWDTLRIIY